MRRFRLLFLLFALALLAPLAILVHRALRSAAVEREMGHRAVAERVFDEMERGLSRVLEREEERPFEQYGIDAPTPPLPFVVGHFQVDPDGSVHALPAARANEQAGGEREEVERTVGAYWRGGQIGANARLGAGAQVPGTTVVADPDAQAAAAPEARDDVAAQRDVSAFDALRSLNKAAMERSERQRKMGPVPNPPPRNAAPLSGPGPLPNPPPASSTGWGSAGEGTGDLFDSARSEMEFPPMTGRVIDGQHLMLYRTVVRGREAYRQGVLLDVGQLGDWLREQGLGGDGLAAYARLSFTAPGDTPAVAGDDAAFVYQHRFAEPFDGLTARLAVRPLPGVGSVAYVYALAGLLLATGVLGLAALYRMVSVVVAFAERRSNFVAAVSHELKTPLTAIRMYGEMLRDGMVPSEAKRDEYYRHITVESERLSRLINNVLEFSRLEKGTREVALVTGTVAPVLWQVAELLRPHVEGQGFDLCLEVDPDLPPVRFEPDALMQVLWNLVDNAVKYARDAVPRRIALRSWRDGGGVHVAVRDHGPGVPTRHLGTIFEPFYRGESELTRRSRGTGLGLALVRGLVERMGARVSGRNVPDGGFEVEIAFRPLAP